MRPSAFPAGCTDPHHIRRWVEAMTAGRMAKYPKCEHIRKNGVRCRLVPLPGARLCHRHLGGGAREDYDRKREPELILIANGVRNRGEVGRECANAQLDCMMRRRLRRAWKSDPLIEGSTIAFEPHSERQVRAYLLKEHGLDIDGVVKGTGWMLTPRAVDRCLWAGYFGITGKSDFRHVARRITDAVGDDIGFYAKVAEMEVIELELSKCR